MSTHTKNIRSQRQERSLLVHKSVKGQFCSHTLNCSQFSFTNPSKCRSQWPRGLRSRSATALLLRLWVRVPPGAWMFVCYLLSDRGLCDELITRSEESYRLWCVIVCDLETSCMRRPLEILSFSFMQISRHANAAIKHALYSVSFHVASYTSDSPHMRSRSRTAKPTDYHGTQNYN